VYLDNQVVEELSGDLPRSYEREDYKSFMMEVPIL
jgi:hypothetical protein